MLRSCSFSGSLTLYRPYVSAIRSASSFKRILWFDARCCLKPIWFVWVITDDKFVSVSLPFTMTGFKYVDGNSFSHLAMAFSTCRKACVFPLPSNSWKDVTIRSSAICVMENVLDLLILVWVISQNNRCYRKSKSAKAWFEQPLTSYWTHFSSSLSSWVCKSDFFNVHTSSFFSESF